MLRILVADDHEVMRRGLRGLLESHRGWQVCAEAGDGHQAVALALELKPDVAVLDMSMPGLDGLEAARQIRRSTPSTEVLAFTAHDSEQLAAAARAAGARDCILKSEAATRLVAAIEALGGGQAPARAEPAPHAAKANPEWRARTQPPRRRLTPREREIVALLAGGKSNWCVATILGISVKTVETHRANIMQKLDIESVVELVHYAIRAGLVAP